MRPEPTHNGQTWQDHDHDGDIYIVVSVNSKLEWRRALPMDRTCLDVLGQRSYFPGLRPDLHPGEGFVEVVGGGFIVYTRQQ